MNFQYIIIGIITSIIASVIVLHFKLEKPTRAIVTIFIAIIIILYLVSGKPTHQTHSVSPAKTNEHSEKSRKKGSNKPIKLQKNPQYHYKNPERLYKQKNTVLSPEKYFNSRLKQLNENHYNLAADLIKKRRL